MFVYSSNKLIQADDESRWKPRTLEKFGKQVTLAEGEKWEDRYYHLYKSIFFNQENTLLTSLRKAAELGCEQALHEIIHLGVNPNDVEPRDMSALHYAAAGGHQLCVEILLKEGADPNVAWHDIKPFELALFSHHIECACALLKKTSIIDFKTFYNLAQRYQKDSLSLLLEHGFQINSCNEYGLTIVHLLANRGNDRDPRVLDMLEWLIERGADVSASDKEGITPLHFACGSRDTQMIDFLLSKGAIMFPKDRFGDTPLHWALWGGCPQDIKNLELENWKWKAFLWGLSIAPYAIKTYLAYQKLKSFLPILRSKD